MSCTASSSAFLSVFLRFGNKRSAVLDSLSRNAFGIYLLHYALVSWLQLSLLSADWPGAAKASAVFLMALVSSWAIVAALRRIPGLARVI